MYFAFAVEISGIILVLEYKNHKVDKMKIIKIGVLLLLGLILGMSAHAQEYPNKPIHIIVPFPPGGGADVLMRPLSKKLSELLGQPIILDNKPGANGNIGAIFTAKSAPDGYTLLVGNSSIPISVSLYSNLGYDPMKDLTMVGLMTIAPSTLASNPLFMAKTIPELISQAKANPGKINYGSAGSGSTPHLGMEMFSLATGTKFTHIPYKGSGPAVTAALGGEVDILITNTSTILSQVQAKKLNPIAVTSLKRSPILPDVPAIAETLPGFEVRTWYGLFGPGNLPKEIIIKLNTAIVQAINTPEIKAQLIKSGYEPETTSSDEFVQLMKDDIVSWGKVVKTSGAKID